MISRAAVSDFEGSREEKSRNKEEKGSLGKLTVRVSVVVVVGS